MTSAEIEAVLGSARFQEMLPRFARELVLADLPAVVATGERANDFDWNYAILCCSALTQSADEGAQAAVLRVVQACLLTDPEETRREAAAILLERLGNRPTLSLAVERNLIEADSWTDAPAPMQLDVIRRRLELSIFTQRRTPIAANLFQRQFWDAAERSRWISVSAPTSAGKSYIVRQWINEIAQQSHEFRAVYVVPTRALIQEVSDDLNADFGKEFAVHTLPWGAEVGASLREVFVLTQERLHLLQQRIPDFSPTMIIVDEAQKFGDGTRGVLLQQVLDEAVRRSPRLQVIFASPLTQNPELLLEAVPGGVTHESLTSEMVTVNQNLLWANQVPRKPQQWSLSLVYEGEPREVGHFELIARPSPPSKRLPFVAVALGGLRSGNVVYVNGAAEAEKVARQIYEALGESADISHRDEVEALQELASSAIHPQYSLGKIIGRGVAFHYGNMPQLVRAEIERLFKEGVLRYLVCTSTLLEGVNLPCRNLFARGPRKGNANKMTLYDFWNLAGRAGRWGKEFQGNIVCVDTGDPSQWPTPPSRRVRQPLERATDQVLGQQGLLLSYIQSGSPLAQSRENPTLESVFSLLAARQAQGLSLGDLVGISVPMFEREGLESAIGNALESVAIPSPLLAKHAGISPLSMQSLLDAFAQERDPEGLILPLPESDDAAQTYVRALARIDKHLGGGFGTAGRQFQLAILITQWMRGMPLAYLINQRLEYARRSGSFNVATVIRNVMTDVEQYARFQAPKYLACYIDVLRHHLQSTGVESSLEDFDLTMMLELGVSRQTDVSLMALGLSRTSAIAVSEYIVDDSLSPADALAWLQGLDLDQFDLPVIVKREIRRRISNQPPAEGMGA